MTLYPIKIAANNNEHARYHVNMGVDVGSPDLRFEWVENGVTQIFYLEIKKLKGKLSSDQIEWNDDFDKNFVSSNCKRDVAHGFIQAKEILLRELPILRHSYP